LIAYQARDPSKEFRICHLPEKRVIWPVLLTATSSPSPPPPLEEIKFKPDKQIDMSKSISTAEVAKHTTAETGLYIIVDDSVYDVTSMYLSIYRAPRKSEYVGIAHTTNKREELKAF
jgi:cytochrome b involved in lipid metabolism